MGPSEGAVQPDDQRHHLRELLGRIALFRDLPAEALDQMVPRFAPVEVAARAVIVRQGAAGDELYVVESGSLAVSATLGGKTVHLGTLGPGDFFGEMAVLRNRPRVATVTATSPARLWSLSRAGLLAIVRQAPGVGQRMSAIMRQRELANALRSLQ
jgi:CRP-like cAMP-binding protein